MSDLFLSRIHVHAPALQQFVRTRRFYDVGDTRYMLHMLLKELFKEHGVSCFHLLREHGQVIQTLAYGPPKEILEEQSRVFADPQAHGCCLWDDLVSKKMPVLPRGKRVSFHTTMYPGRKWNGVEQDAFLLRSDASLTREEAYEEWLRKKLEGAVNLEGLRLLGFREEMRTLRTHPSKIPLGARFLPTHGDSPRPPSYRRLPLPVADLEGTFEILDPEVFSDLLAKGIGRHRHLGFGLLRLLPASA